MAGIIGIDLGTTSSAVAVYKDGHPTVITTSEGRHIPSLVAFNRNGELIVGEAARRQAAVNPADAVYSIKRLLGRRFDDPVTQLECRRQPFTMRRDADGGIAIFTPGSGRILKPQEVAAAILRRLKQEAESYLGSSVRQAVLTVPSFFDDNQRQAMEEAGRLAGLDILSVINEPTAAALAYGALDSGRKKVLVVDLGGGNYDVSALEIDNASVTVHASDGDPSLGGEDWDAVIATHLADEFLRYHGIDLAHNERAARRLREAAEEVRKQLSNKQQVTIDLPFISSGSNGPRHLKMTVTQSEFESLTASLTARLVEPLHRVLQNAGMRASDLDSVLLVGGASQARPIQEIIGELTGLVPVENIDPQEMVALGAALRAGVLAGDVQDLQWKDVTPLSLGLETMGGLMTTIIPRNTPLPVRRTETFSTSEDGQTEVEVHVLQGERLMASDNTRLGVLQLQEIPVAPRGIPQIEVTFELDAGGILHIGAEDMATGSSHALTVSIWDGLEVADVQRLMEEAASHESEDIRRRTLVEARNLARQTIYQTERCLEHLNGLAGRSDCREKRQEISVKVEALQTALVGRDVERIRTLTGEVRDASTLLNQLAYGRTSKGKSDEGREHNSGSPHPRKYTEITVERL